MNEFLKNHRKNINNISFVDEIDAYMSLDGVGTNQVKKHLKVYRDNMQDYKTIPVCILSHMFDKRRSKLLVKLVEEASVKGLDRDYYIFTYEDQRELYNQFEHISRINVVYISLDNPVYLTLSGKRQYILEWNQQNNNDHAFFIEDDCFDFVLPIGAFGEGDSFRNKQFLMSLSTTFGFWESLILNNDLQYSAPVNNMEFAFRNLSEHPFIKHLGQTIQAVHIGTKFCKERNINFDHNAGWDDYDMIIQQCVYGQGTHALIFSYNTPSLKSGVSAMSSSADALAKRCEKNTTALINKWGLSLVREDTKKGLYNAKINWSNIRSAYNCEMDLTQLLKLTHEEAKQQIKEFKSQTIQIGDW